MIVSSRRAKLLAMMGALAVNGALVLALPFSDSQMGDEGATREGAASVTIATGFADLAETIRAENRGDMAATAERSAAMLSAEAAQPLAAAPVQPVEAVRAEAATEAPPAALEAASPSQAARAQATDRVSANMLRPATRSRAVQSAHEERAAERAAARAAARPATSSAPTRSSSNTSRSGNTAASTAPRSSATPSRTSNAQAQAARAAAQAYPNQVFRCVARAGRINARGSGTARVQFSIGGNGRIGNVALTRSSGNRSVDRAVVAHIRRAGPCPAPPPGAQRQFSLPVQVN